MRLVTDTATIEPNAAGTMNTASRVHSGLPAIANAMTTSPIPAKAMYAQPAALGLAPRSETTATADAATAAPALNITITHQTIIRRSTLWIGIVAPLSNHTQDTQSNPHP